ncbi:glycosyltransferase family 9 protein [bacterium]|nr:glycosyltransferase family 9 protein [bacterium]
MSKLADKILVIRLGAIGDVVHTMNTFRAIKKQYPDVSIHYMTTKTQACFLENDPDIEKVVVVDKNEFKFAKSKPLVQRLKAENYDLVINLQPNFKTRFVCFMAGIKKQLLYKKTFKRHAVDNFFQTAKKYYKNIELAAEMSLYLSEEAKDFAQKELAALPRPLIIFNAGGIISPRQGRTYPVDKWLELGNILEQKFKGTIILTGTQDDYKFLNPLEKLPSVKSFIGKTTLEQNAAIIGACDLMISGESGPLHIATALKVPSVGLYGSMPISRTGTYGNSCVSIKSDMKCIPCNRRKCKYIKGTDEIYAPCMKSIDVNAIVENVEKLLK